MSTINTQCKVVICIFCTAKWNLVYINKSEYLRKYSTLQLTAFQNTSDNTTINLYKLLHHNMYRGLH